MPWQISNVQPHSLTFQDFWREELASKCPDRVLSQVFIGKAKDCLDRVASDLVVLEVATIFGRYIKYLR